jgi:hypothetical protein
LLVSKWDLPLIWNSAKIIKNLSDDFQVTCHLMFCGENGLIIILEYINILKNIGRGGVLLKW